MSHLVHQVISRGSRRAPGYEVMSHLVHQVRGSRRAPGCEVMSHLVHQVRGSRRAPGCEVMSHLVHQVRGSHRAPGCEVMSHLVHQVRGSRRAPGYEVNIVEMTGAFQNHTHFRKHCMFRYTSSSLFSGHNADNMKTVADQ